MDDGEDHRADLDRNARQKTEREGCLSVLWARTAVY